MDVYDVGVVTIVFAVIVVFGYAVYLVIAPFVGTSLAKILLAGLGIPIGWALATYRREISGLADRVRGPTGG